MFKSNFFNLPSKVFSKNQNYLVVEGYQAGLELMI